MKDRYLYLHVRATIIIITHNVKCLWKAMVWVWMVQFQLFNNFLVAQGEVFQMAH